MSKATIKAHTKKDDAEKPTCGIVMPISAMQDYDESHWVSVRSILTDSIEDAGFTARLVSEASDIGVIQTRIVENLYADPIVVCDVSGKNANVMFELGLRLAFDKPVIIVKDDMTSYSFDTSPIEHVGYRRDLRYHSVLDFKQQLTQRIIDTVARSQADETYSPFLKHFGKFTVKKVDSTEVSPEEFLAKQIDAFRSEMRAAIATIRDLRSPSRSQVATFRPNSDDRINANKVIQYWAVERKHDLGLLMKLLITQEFEKFIASGILPTTSEAFKFLDETYSSLSLGLDEDESVSGQTN